MILSVDLYPYEFLNINPTVVVSNRERNKVFSAN